MLARASRLSKPTETKHCRREIPIHQSQIAVLPRPKCTLPRTGRTESSSALLHRNYQTLARGHRADCSHCPPGEGPATVRCKCGLYKISGRTAMHLVVPQLDEASDRGVYESVRLRD